MQRPINLASLVNGLSGCPNDQAREFFPLFEQVLSGRPSRLAYKVREVASLASLVRNGLAHGIDESRLDGFAFSYAIPHISKEYDLLKIGSQRVLNIELKSERKPPADIARQLHQNRYYLSFLQKPIAELGYCASDDSWTMLDDTHLRPISWREAAAAIAELANDPFETELDTLFAPSNYLVSPIMDVDRFLAGSYFLGSQQQQIKDFVCARLGAKTSDVPGGAIVSGTAGTGKSLLLYDIAKTIAQQTGQQAAIFHGAPLSEHHLCFNRRSRDVIVLDPSHLTHADVSEYCFVGFDEAHRIRPEQFHATLARTHEAGVPYLVLLDSRQGVSKQERRDDVERIARELVPEARCFELTKRFRSNAAIASYVDALVFGKRGTLRSAGDISLDFAPTDEVARRLVKRFVADGYQHIALTSTFRSEPIEAVGSLGTPGTLGSPGTMGAPGALGMPGATGAMEPTGTLGTPVALGMPGATGTPGTMGSAEALGSVGPIDRVAAPSARSVIGLEYDSVVMVVPPSIGFNGKRLCDKPHRDSDLLPTKLLYQGLTRARDRIALIFRCDWQVFRYATELLAEARH
ncbi:MAG: DUF2075 domain-containing protein [Atopobiaceae bacterium]|nr:DUF2075 domain-containing protein [Atopobiaceae bacterium]